MLSPQAMQTSDEGCSAGFGQTKQNRRNSVGKNFKTGSEDWVPTFPERERQTNEENSFCSSDGPRDRQFQRG
jgi:hypothetical protein